MPSSVRILSSMATRQLLTDLVAMHTGDGPSAAVVESVGGVDAAKRVRAGEAVDVVVLASNVVDALIAEGRLVAPRVDLVRSGIAVAVRRGAPRLDIASEDAVRRAVEGARSLAYSTGPSGVYLKTLFERWGLADSVRARLVTPPPGVPVGSLVADGRVELGFQQMSELMHLDGLDVLGPLPPAIQLLTTFSGAVGAASAHAAAARALLDAMAGPAGAAAKRANGMEPA